MLGIAIVKAVNPSPHFVSFKLGELIPYIVWGVGSAFLIEIIGAYGIWEYIPNTWNIELFNINGKAITSLAPMTWFIAPILHYTAALILTQRSKNAKIDLGK